VPNDEHYQGCIFGLGDDGVLYIGCGLDTEWEVYLPLDFKLTNKDSK